MKNFTKSILVIIGVIGISSTALSHSKVSTTNPEAGAVLTETPATIDMKFVNKVRLTRVILQIEDQDSTNFDLEGYEGFENNFSFTNASKSSGQYTIEWRGLGTDGHVMQGEFSFTVE